MARIFITGSTDGLGRGAAEELLDSGHSVVLHARNAERATVLDDLIARRADLVVGDLTRLDETRAVAEAVNRLGRMDAIIHNAGVAHTPEALLPVNVVAPYLLTALIDRPARLIYISSQMHLDGRADLDGIDWSGTRATRTYSDSKLLVTALAFHVAQLWPEVVTNAVCPGWMPTRMGGAEATGDLKDGRATQVWLATSDDPRALASGNFWQHMTQRQPHPATRDRDFQQDVADALAAYTGLTLT
ncbi:MAG: SDR family NAD(P)-dependent oxidoreductase [Propionibacteriaceae bacterium]|nr:SDR family NAD(P)-dependent oxidoreductase [Propionibacteriaceae bacterium]